MARCSLIRSMLLLTNMLFCRFPDRTMLLLLLLQSVLEKFRGEWRFQPFMGKATANAALAVQAVAEVQNYREEFAEGDTPQKGKGTEAVQGEVRHTVAEEVSAMERGAGAARGAAGERAGGAGGTAAGAGAAETAEAKTADPSPKPATAAPSAGVAPQGEAWVPSLAAAIVKDYPSSPSSFFAANNAAVLSWLQDAEAATAAADDDLTDRSSNPLGIGVRDDHGVSPSVLHYFDQNHQGDQNQGDDQLGPEPLSPIVEYYFAQKHQGKQRWDQSLGLGCVVGTKATLEQSVLPKRVPSMLKHVPMLGQVVMRVSMKAVARQLEDSLAVEDKVRG